MATNFSVDIITRSLVNEHRTGTQASPALTATGDGFVVAWYGLGTSSSQPGYGVWAQKLDRYGNAIDQAICVNFLGSNPSFFVREGAHAYGLDVASTPDGGFVVAWFENSYQTSGGRTYPLKAWKFDASGNLIPGPDTNSFGAHLIDIWQSDNYGIGTSTNPNAVIPPNVSWDHGYIEDVSLTSGPSGDLFFSIAVGYGAGPTFGRESEDGLYISRYDAEFKLSPSSEIYAPYTFSTEIATSREGKIAVAHDYQNDVYLDLYNNPTDFDRRGRLDLPLTQRPDINAVVFTEEGKTAVASSSPEGGAKGRITIFNADGSVFSSFFTPENTRDTKLLELDGEYVLALWVTGSSSLGPSGLSAGIYDHSGLLRSNIFEIQPQRTLNKIQDPSVAVSKTGSVLVTYSYQDAYATDTSWNIVAQLLDIPLAVPVDRPLMLIGGGSNDVLIGAGANDTLLGGAGQDTLDGGGGDDRMEGGLGNDTYVVDNAGDQTIESSPSALEIDTVQSSITRGMSTNIENLVLTGTAAINGTGNALANRITGNGAANSLVGGAGNDTLIGGSGADTLNGSEGADRMEGGFGGDVFIVDSVGDVVVELAGQGNDRVSTALSYTLAVNVEALTLTGSGSFSGTGNELANLIQGNSGDNALSGLAGNDTLFGAAGRDMLDGGTGFDFMVGQEGDDVYIVDSTADRTIEYLVSMGTDTVFSSVNRTLSTNVDNMVLTGTAVQAAGNALNNVLTGNALANTLLGVTGNDTLIGNDGNDTLIGGLGVDRMEGGAGDDLFTVDAAGDVVVELFGQGTDRISSTISWTLADNVENLTLAGTSNIGGTGNALANTLGGNPGANALAGGGGDDTISGGDGNDTLTGGTGNDRLTGGNGADVFRFGTLGDGLDTVTDFVRGTDKIAVVAANFGLVAGQAANVVVNGSPSSSAAVFLYTSATGLLAFDADGTGPQAAVPLLTLANRPGTLAPGDLVLGG